MVDEERQLTFVEQIEKSLIRRVWHQDEWWFSLVDVISVFAGTKRARKYWYDLKDKIIREETNKSLLTNIKQLKIKSTDGKCYNSDMANLAIVKSILQRASPSIGRSLQPTKSEIEKNIEDALANDLRNLGCTVKQQVSCANGRADIVTNEAIYEIKAFLTRDRIYRAIGQLFSYQMNINPSAHLFIVGCKPKNRGEQKIEASLATSLGIEVVVWDWDSLELFAQRGQLKKLTVVEYLAAIEWRAK